MLTIKHLALVSFAALLTFSLNAQSNQSSQDVKDVEKLKPALKEIFQLRDQNGDGIIEGAEYTAWGGGAKLYDRNGDGLIVASEYAAYFEPKPPVKAKASAKDASSAAIMKLQTGKYTCFGYGLNASGGSSYSYVYKGHFFLRANNKYEANNTAGTYSLTAKDGMTTIRFKNGAYDGITGEVTLEDNEPKIVLTWPPAKPGGRSSKQYCRRTKGQ